MSSHSISILCINDFHAEIFECEHAPGAARLATWVKQYKDTHPNTIVVFGGDNYKGDPINDHLSGEPVTFFMHSLGTVASAVGNHEFDYGLDKLQDWSRQCNYTFVCANVIDPKSREIPTGFKPYIMVETGGVKVALIGLSTTEQRLHPMICHESVRELAIVNGANEARMWADYLLAGHDPHGKPDLIVALTHFGLKSSSNQNQWIGKEVIELCQRVPELSGGFTAHWHQFVSGRINGVPVVQGGSNGRGFAVLEVELNVVAQRGQQVFQVQHVNPYYVNGYEHAESTSDSRGEDEAGSSNLDLQQQLQMYQEQAMQELGVVVANAESAIVHRDLFTAEIDIEGTSITRLATEVMRKETKVPIALMYSGRIGPYLAQGEVTRYDLLKLFPFNDEIITIRMNGYELLRNLENGMCSLRQERASPIAVGGLCIVADYARPFRKRIEILKLEDGVPFNLHQDYELAVDSWLASGEMGYDFSSASEVKHTGLFLRDCMIRVIQETGQIPAIKSDNVIVKHKLQCSKENEPC